jgi:hypothetical protein
VKGRADHRVPRRSLLLRVEPQGADSASIEFTWSVPATSE